MSIIVPPARPKRDRSAVEAVLERYSIPLDRTSLVLVRGHYLDSLGRRGANDINLFDDAAYIVAPEILESFNANTDPAFLRERGRDLAFVKPGHYQFYPDFHKPTSPRKYWALRPYPEGREMPAIRGGKDSIARHTNIHKGGSTAAAVDRTWSRACMTIFGPQYPEWELRVKDALRRFPPPTGAKTRTGKSAPVIDVILIENRLHGGQQFWTDHAGRII